MYRGDFIGFIEPYSKVSKLNLER